MLSARFASIGANSLKSATATCIRRGKSMNRLNKMNFSSYPAHTVVAMPALSPTMEAGSIAKWNLKEGDKFSVGTSFCDVETDKATISFDATEEGYIAKLLVSTGEIKVGQPIMVTVEDQADVAAFGNFTVSASAAPAAAAPVAPKAAPAAVVAPVVAPSSSSAPRAAAATVSDGSRLFASPFARKLAKEAGSSVEEVAAQLKAAGIAGSGPNGRIVAEDVMRASTLPKAGVAAKQTAAPAAAAASKAPVSTGAVGGAAGVFVDYQLSDFAQNLASRLTQTKQAVPHYYLSVELNLSNLLATRKEFNDKFAAAAKGKKGAVPTELSVLDFLVKASALAMAQVPDVNGAWMDTFVRRYSQVDINLVMGAGNFVATPVIRNANGKGLSTISQEIVSFEDSLFSEDDAVSNAAVADESKMAVGTFSIHNLGIYGVKSAAPIVLSPQACALALGAITETVIPATPTAENNNQNWETAPILTATLSCDHRVVDGAVGAQWLAAFKQLVENPLSMLL